MRCRQQPDVAATALVPNMHVSLRSDLQGYIVRPIHNEHTSCQEYIVSFGESTQKSLLLFLLCSYISRLMKIGMAFLSLGNPSGLSGLWLKRLSRVVCMCWPWTVCPLSLIYEFKIKFRIVRNHGLPIKTLRNLDVIYWSGSLRCRSGDRFEGCGVKWML